MEDTTGSNATGNALDFTSQPVAQPVAQPVDAGKLADALNSSVFYPIDSDAVKALGSAGKYRIARLIKRGDNSKLPESLAIAVPFVSSLALAIQEPELVEYFTDAMQKLQDNYLAARASSGIRQVSFEELSARSLAAYLRESDSGSSGIGQLSAERITAWFNANAKDSILVALAMRLQLEPDSLTDADIKRLDQISNQLRDNLAKLSAKKPVSFDPKVKVMLNWALDSLQLDAADTVYTRIKAKLNQEVKEDDFASALGF